MKDVPDPKKMSKVVIKTPYGGNSSCVAITDIYENPMNLKFEDWLGIFIKEKFINQINCLGFNKALIVQPFNPYLDDIGEFRIFAVDGEIFFITYTNNNFPSEHNFFPLAIRQGLLDSSGQFKTITKEANLPEDFGSFQYKLDRKVTRLLVKKVLVKNWDGSSSGEIKKPKPEKNALVKELFKRFKK